MKNQNVLIIDNDADALRCTTEVLNEAGISYRAVSTEAEGWTLLRTEPQISLVIIRNTATGIDGEAMCRRIRDVGPHRQLQILAIVREDQLETAGRMLEAGADDVLIDPFEPRELRMRANIQLGMTRRRVDEPHLTSRASAESGTQDQPQTVDPDNSAVRLVMPEFDKASLSFRHAATADELRRWNAEESAEKVVLDQYMCCPQCHSLPTFRFGCGECGSSVQESEVLLHHFACAHVGPESEFRTEDGIVCPKCRTADMVAGADFEVVSGATVCADCHSNMSSPVLIGHCLNCQHRFAAEHAEVRDLAGYRVHEHHRQKAAGPIAVRRPRRNVRRRPVRSI